MSQVKLGTRVTDSVTGFSGMATARTEFLYRSGSMNSGSARAKPQRVALVTRLHHVRGSAVRSTLNHEC